MLTGTFGVWLAGIITAASALLGGIVAWRKISPEKDSIIVTAAQGALVVQAGVLDELREELARNRQRLTDVEKALRDEIRRLRTERDSLRSENAELKARVAQLEGRVRELEAHSS